MSRISMLLRTLMLDMLNLPGIKPRNIKVVNGRVVIQAVVDESSPPVCPDCHQAMHRHGRRTNTFADLLDGQPVQLEVERPRYRCCGKINTPELTFIDEKRRATRRLVESIRADCLSKTFRGMAEETGLAVNTIKNIAHDLVDELDHSVHTITPTIMGVAVLNLAGASRCVITNLATNTIFEILSESDQKALKSYFKALPNTEGVEWVFTDMCTQFPDFLSQYFSSATFVIDKFYVLAMVSEAFKSQLRKYRRTLEKEDRVFVKKSILWLSAKRPGSLDKDEQQALQIVRDHIPSLSVAFDVKEEFCKIYDEPTMDGATQAFRHWKSGLKPNQKVFLAIGRTVDRHFDEIFARWVAPSKITNALAEASSGIMTVADNLGRGYSFDVLRAKILYAKRARDVGRSVMRTEPIHEGAGNSKLDLEKAQLSKVVEYGAHIPTLVEMAERGEFN